MKIKRILSFILALIMCCSTFIAPAYAEDGVRVMFDEDMTFLWNTYQNELEAIETETNQDLSTLDREAVSTISQSVALKHYGDENFEDLLSEIAVFCAEYKLLTSPAVNARGNGRIENLVTTVIAGPDYLTGRIITLMNADLQETMSYSVTFQSGEIIKGSAISMGFSFERSRTFSGPSAGTLMANGRNATHNCFVGLLYGTVVYMEYDYIDNVTGDRFHMANTSIEESTRRLDQFTLLTAQTATTWYIQHASKQVVYQYANRQAFETALNSIPEFFIMD